MNLSISHIVIAMDSPHEILQTSNFDEFIVDHKKPNYFVEFVPSIKGIKPNGEKVISNIDYCIYKENNEFCRYFYHPRFQDVIYAKSQWDWAKKKILVEYISCYEEFLSELGNALFHIGLEQIMLREQRLIFHAACVETSYGGILFTGPAGAGKSTQADLWLNYRDALLINGDRPILSKDDNVWRAWGSPYAGSSKCYVNKCCEVKAIIQIVQNSENRVSQLKGSRAFSAVFSGVTVNDWSREDVNMASELVIELVNSVPVFKMHCTNTEEAVEVLEKVLRGKENL